MAKKKSKTKNSHTSTAHAHANVKTQKKTQQKAQDKIQAKAQTGKKRPDNSAHNIKPTKAKSDSAKISSTKKRAALIGGIIVAVAAVIACVAFVVLNIGKANLLQPDGYDTSNLKVYSNAQSSDGGKTVTYNGATYKLNESIIPICIMGNDKGLHTPASGTNGQADAIMVIAVNTENNDIKGISIPRDSMVKSLKKFRDVYKNSSYNTDKMQICLTYACGSTDEESSKLVTNAASELLFGIPIKHYYTLWTDGLGELANLADGVTLEALYTIPETYYPSTLPIVAGETVTLRGNDALRYVQYRDITRYETALERLERQRQFVSALAKKLLERVKDNPSIAIDIYNALQQYSKTSLGTAEFGYLASVAASTNTHELELTRLEGEAVHDSANPWEQYKVNEASTYQTVLDTFYTKVN